MSTGRTPLDRDHILRVAVDHADRHGVAKLSMRELAKAVGCGAMSLYNHVANKDDLLEGMAELVAAEVDPIPDDIAWKEGIYLLATAIRKTLLRHPWAVPLWTSAFPGPNRFQQMEDLLGLIERGGLTGRLGDVAFHAVNHHVIGFTQQQLAYQMPEEQWRAVTARFDAEITAERFPRTVAHKHYHDEVERGDADHPDEFLLVLELILDGLERRRDLAVAD